MSTGRNAPRGVTKRAIAALMFWKKDSAADSGVAESAPASPASVGTGGSAADAPANGVDSAGTPSSATIDAASEPVDAPNATSSSASTDAAGEPADVPNATPASVSTAPEAADVPVTTAEPAATSAPAEPTEAATARTAEPAAAVEADRVPSTNGAVAAAEPAGAPTSSATTAVDADNTPAPAPAEPTPPPAAEPAPAKKAAPRKKAAAKTADPSAPAKKTAAKKLSAAKPAAAQDAAPAPEAGAPAAPAPTKAAKAPAKKAPAKKTAAAKSTTPRKTARKTAAPKAEERTLTPRRLADSTYRDEQLAARYEGPIAPFNHLVDRLAEESGEPLPHLAPIYGGTEARVLSLFRDPGPKSRSGQQTSGLLSPENDDHAAERYLEFFQTSGLQITDLITWNAYPWYTTRKPSTADIDRGIAPLEQVIALLPELKVILAHGLDAQAAWRRFEKQHPEVAGKLTVIPTYHTSKQALFTQDEAVRAQREDKLRSDFAKAAEHLAE